MFFKRGDKKDPNNYQGTNLLNTHFKLITGIISSIRRRVFFHIHKRKSNFLVTIVANKKCV